MTGWATSLRTDLYSSTLGMGRLVTPTLPVLRKDEGKEKLY